MHIHPDRLTKITDESILKSFVEAKPRRMEFGGIENHFLFLYFNFIFLPLSLCGIYLFARELIRIKQYADLDPSSPS